MNDLLVESISHHDTNERGSMINPKLRMSNDGTNLTTN